MAPLQNQVKNFWLRKQKITDEMEKVLEPVIDSVKKVFELVTETITDTTKKSHNTNTDLNENFLEIRSDKGKIDFYLTTPVIIFFLSESENHFQFKKDQKSDEMKIFLINTNIPFTLHSNWFKFRDTNKKFELKGDHLAMKTTCIFHIDKSHSCD